MIRSFQSPIYRDYYCYAIGTAATGTAATFQSPIYRDYYCYPFFHKLGLFNVTFSPLFIGIIIVTPIIAISQKLFICLSVPYLSGLLLLRPFLNGVQLIPITFSPLFIGIIIVTQIQMVGMLFLIAFSPLFIGIIIVTYVEYGHRTRNHNFQSPIYRDYYCYEAHHVTRPRQTHAFSPLFIGIIIVTDFVFN